MGADRYVGFGLESSYAAAEPAAIYVDPAEESFDVETQQDERSRMSEPGIASVSELSRRATGSVVLAGGFNDLAVMLQQFFGSAKTQIDTPSAGLYTHEFPDPDASVVPSRAGFSTTAEVGRAGASLVWAYTGLKCVRFTVSAGRDQAPVLGFEFVGKDSEKATQQTPSIPLWVPIVSSDVAITIDAAAVPAKAWQLTADWPVNEAYKLGQTTQSKEPLDGVMRVSGSITAHVDDDSFWSDFNTKAEVDLVMAATDADDHKLQFDLSKARLTSSPMSQSTEEFPEAVYNFTSYRNALATQNLLATLVNDVAAASALLS